jgi:diacylglycerol kinase family enzyme
VVVPAGTRNHFARDLGLDIKNPARALTALLDAEPVRVDLGVVGSRVFVNNVSFGFYAEALLEPGYRAAKARSFASVAPRYLEGQRWVPASVAAPGETIERPQVVLVSNNPYHLATLRSLGRRFSLSSGLLGVVVIKRPADPPPPPDLLPRMRHELRQQG